MVSKSGFVKLNTDGSACGNPGQASAGVYYEIILGVGSRDSPGKLATQFPLLLSFGALEMVS
jgi:hypothetical protein